MDFKSRAVLMVCVAGMGAGFGAWELPSAQPGLITTASQPSASAAGDSSAPILTSDGGRLFFFSDAPNLLESGTRPGGLALYQHDLATGQHLRLVPEAIDPASVSSDGSMVAFGSSADGLVDGATGRVQHVYAWLQGEADVVLVDRDATGAVSQGARGPSYHTGRSLAAGQGRWVAFESRASNLVEGVEVAHLLGVIPFNQVYLRDVQTNHTWMVSVSWTGVFSGSGHAALEAMTPDGRYVVFTSASTNLVEGLPGEVEHVHVRDMREEQTRVASLGAASMLPGPGPWLFAHALISDDGRHVAFKAEHASGSAAHVFLHDLMDGATLHISDQATPLRPLSMSADGGRLAYDVTPSDGTADQVWVWDRATGSNTLASVSLDGTGPGQGASRHPRLSADGSALVFASRAGNLTADGVNGRAQLFWRHLGDGVTRLITRAGSGGGSNGDHEFSGVSLSADGGRVAFDTEASDLAAGDGNDGRDVWVWEAATETLTLVSSADPARLDRTTVALPRLWPGSLGADLNRVAFTSWDGLLSPDDTNGVDDLFLWRSQTGVAEPIGLDPSVPPTQRVMARDPALSADGRTLVFLRHDLDPARPWGLGEAALWVWREGFPLREVEPRPLVRQPPGVSPYGFYGTINPTQGLSHDGRWLVYIKRDGELEVGREVLLYDVASGQSEVIHSGVTMDPDDAWIQAPFFSPDDQWIVHPTLEFLFSTVRWRIVARNVSSGLTRVIVESGDSRGIRGALMSADSSRLVCMTRTNELETALIACDVVSGSNQVVDVASSFPSQSLSADGRFLCYVASRPEAWQLRVVDLVGGAAEEVPETTDGAWLPQRIPTDAHISADGRFVVFAKEQVVETTPTARVVTQVLAWDRWAGQTLVVSLNRDGSAPGHGPSNRPVLAADGRRVVFQSFADDLIAGDEGRTRDLYVLELTGQDVDGDGMEDAWEAAYFDTLERDGTGDMDGDGISDGGEYRAGTDPTNEGSVLRVLELRALGGDEVTLIWSSEPGRTYRVQYLEDPAGLEWMDLPGDVVTSGGQGTKVDATMAEVSGRYYRVLLVGPGGP